MGSRMSMKSTHETDADRQNGRSNVNNNNNKDVVASNYFKSMMSKENCSADPTFDVNELKERFNRTMEQNISSPVITVRNDKIGKFSMVKTLGTGTFGRVVLAKVASDQCDDYADEWNIHNNYKYFSLKIMKKSLLMKLHQLDHLMNEKRLMSALDCPFFVRCINSYKDNTYIFLQMEYMPGGEMFTHLRKSRRFNESLSKFYAAQVVLAFEYIHSLSIIYRDLKPENILMALDGYIKITDFGFAKQIKTHTWTMCGTPEYLAPEIILNKGYNSSVDWWSLGILIFEMCSGCPPFYDTTPMRIYEKVLQNRIKYAPFFSYNLREIIKKLLEKDVTQRVGNLANGALDVKQCSWFLGHVNWKDIYTKKMRPMRPINATNPEDTKNFDEYDEESLCSENECQFEEEFEKF